MTTKYHSNGNKCEATQRACPLGEGEHYESPQAAAVASMNAEQEAFTKEASAEATDAAETEELRLETIRRATVSGHNRATPEEAAEVLTAEHIATHAHRIYDYLAENGLDDDSDVREVAFEYAAAKLGVDYDKLYDAWLEQRPLTENHDFWTEHGESRHGLNPLESEVFASERLETGFIGTVAQADGTLAQVVATDTHKGTGKTFYQTADGYWHSEDEVTQASARTDRDQSASRDGLKDPNHRYGFHGEPKDVKERNAKLAHLEVAIASAQRDMNLAESKKEFFELTKQKGDLERQARQVKAQQQAYEAVKAHKAGKALDPAMLEALKLKYLKKFKRRPEDDGVDTMTLLNMARKGELD